MPRPCSLDLRMRVLREVEAGASRREAAECVEVSASSAIKWMQRLNETGSIAAKPSGGSISPLEAHAAVLLGLIAEQADLTLDEIVAVDAQAPDRRQPQRGLAVLQAAQCQLQKNHLGQRPPVGVETVEVYPLGGRERPTAFWWHATPQKNMVHGLLRT